MSTAFTVRDKINHEIDLLPEERLPEVYHLVQDFRQALGPKEMAPSPVMRFAGSWSDMSDNEFDSLSDEIDERRRKSFSGRRE